ncbi:MAG: DUF1018 domain-containing protein [Spirochaetes bacterium]|nr:DUF1018 domain-containing protein [Spirochaetota bacterium]
MDEPMLRVVVASVSGSESISSLTWPQLIQSIRALEQEKKRRRRHASYERGKQYNAGTIFLPTEEQRQLVSSLLDEIDFLITLKNREAYLYAICWRSFRKEYRHIDRRDTVKLIEALKSIIDRAKRNSQRLGSGSMSERPNI